MIFIETIIVYNTVILKETTKPFHFLDNQYQFCLLKHILLIPAVSYKWLRSGELITRAEILNEWDLAGHLSVPADDAI